MAAAMDFWTRQSISITTCGTISSRITVEDLKMVDVDVGSLFSGIVTGFIRQRWKCARMTVCVIFRVISVVIEVKGLGIRLTPMEALKFRSHKMLYLNFDEPLSLFFSN